MPSYKVSFYFLLDLIVSRLFAVSIVEKKRDPDILKHLPEIFLELGSELLMIEVKEQRVFGFSLKENN